MLIHQVPSSGFAPGASVELSSSARSTFARTTNAAFETPSKLYAANSPYSLSSLPCIGVLLAVFSKFGTPKRSTNSFCDVTLNAVFAFADVVASAMPVPAAFVLSCAVATTIRGVVPGSAGV